METHAGILPSEAAQLRLSIAPCRQKERAMPYGDQSGDAVTVALGEDCPELRESVRKICEKYPGAPRLSPASPPAWPAP